MKTSLIILLALSMSTPVSLLAVEHNAKGDMKSQDMASTLTNTGNMTEAEVRKVNLEQGLVTLKHQEIKNLGMPGMTMIFHIKDKSQLGGIKPGDRVIFTAERNNGEITVTSIQKE